MGRIPSQARRLGVLAAVLLVAICAGAANDGDHAATAASLRQVRLVFTNDFESAYDPIPAYWRDDVAFLGGAPQLATLVHQVRSEAPLSFLFDAGDIFTGTLSKLTAGELPFELMITMGYDAMTIGNHEFEYGWRTLRHAKTRAPFPVLAANIFYTGTDIPFAQPYAVLERDGFRVGVVGVIGLDAATALQPDNVRGLEFRDPVSAVRAAVAELRDEVDLVVLLAHEGKTAPMQTDAAAHPEVQRGIAADLEMAAAVRGIDVILCGHADAGTEHAVVQPDTGTLVMQTYGHGTRLGVLDLTVDTTAHRVVEHAGRLLLVDSQALPPDRMVAAKLARYRAAHPEIREVVGHGAARLTRRYDQESALGDLFADILRAHAGTPVAVINPGALRADLPAGELTREDLLDAFPFTDRVVVVEVTGARLLAAIEQGLSLERGILQVSGLTVRYDLSRPAGNRAVDVRVGDEPLNPDRIYRVATISILAQGGDLYTAFSGAPATPGKPFAQVLERWVAGRGMVTVPAEGRLLPLTAAVAAR